MPGQSRPGGFVPIPIDRIYSASQCRANGLRAAKWGRILFEFWLADENLFFVGSLFLLLGLMVLQLSGISDFGPDIDSNIDGPADGVLAVLGIGRVPLLIWLALFLMLFTVIGYAGQQCVQALTGGLLPPLLAVPLAGIATLPVAAILARPLARIMPKDETTAVSLESLVGRFAAIEIGTARKGSAARAKVTDVHGHDHFVMVEPDNETQSFVTGEQLLLVRREGDIFKAISRGGQHLPRLDG